MGSGSKGEVHKLIYLDPGEEISSSSCYIRSSG